jgi:peptidoglycan/LPS O-acetylase OafA/YrhL
MNLAPGYPIPAQRVDDDGIGSRWSAPAQSVVSAALVIPTIPLWYLRLLPADRGWDSVLDGLWTVAVTLLIDVYFVAMVAIFARNSRRRMPALATAVVASVLDLADTALVSFVLGSELLRWADRVLIVVMLVLFVSAWGIARRRRPLWVIGLAPTFVIAIGLAALYASDWLYDTFTGVYIVFWVLWIGGFLLCSVICWGFDALSSAARSKERAQ